MKQPKLMVGRLRFRTDLYRKQSAIAPGGVSAGQGKVPRFWMRYCPNKVGNGDLSVAPLCTKKAYAEAGARLSCWSACRYGIVLSRAIDGRFAYVPCGERTGFGAVTSLRFSMWTTRALRKSQTRRPFFYSRYEYPHPGSYKK